jgi:hypothetical protein
LTQKEAVPAWRRGTAPDDADPPPSIQKPLPFFPPIAQSGAGQTVALEFAMISQVLLFALLGAGGGGANPGSARQAYTKCLRMMMASELKSKTDAAAFQTKLGTACQAEADAFKAASIESDVSTGIRRASAEQNAADDLKDILGMTVDRYKEYLETNTSPA